MLKILALVLLLAVVAILLRAASKPDTFSISRSTTIAAAPEQVFLLINDLHGFNRWNPWQKKGPSTGSYSGPAAGVGAAYAWDGKQVGTGRMEITESLPGQRVGFRLDFYKPFAAQNQASFVLSPVANGTQVLWTMTGPSPFISKLMGTIFNMDNMVGKDFEAGLASMKTLAEAPR